MLTMTNADGTRLIRVMLVDDQTLILDGFVRIIDAQPDIASSPRPRTAKPRYARLIRPNRT